MRSKILENTGSTDINYAFPKKNFYARKMDFLDLRIFPIS